MCAIFTNRKSTIFKGQMKTSKRGIAFQRRDIAEIGMTASFRGEWKGSLKLAAGFVWSDSSPRQASKAHH